MVMEDGEPCLAGYLVLNFFSHWHINIEDTATGLTPEVVVVLHRSIKAATAGA
jgi:hypothetical protein